MLSWGMPPSMRLAGFRSRCTHDILFLLRNHPTGHSQEPHRCNVYVCGQTARAPEQELEHMVSITPIMHKLVGLI